MYYIALCDDNPYDLELLRGYLAELKSCHLHGEILCFSSGQQLVEAYRDGRRFDLAVLDMCMDRLNGMETARLIRTLDADVPLLFATSTPDFAVEGYTVGAYRYLLKPIDKAFFLESVKQLLGRSTAQSHYFTFTGERGMTKISHRDILYLESAGRTVTLHTATETHTFPGKIGDIGEALAPFGFIRVHKSYVANLHRVVNLYKETVHLEEGASLPLGRQYSKAVHLAVLRLAQEEL